jgi:hypothetical protein
MYQEEVLIRFSRLIRGDQSVNDFTVVSEEIRADIEQFSAGLVVDQTDITVTVEII